MEGLGLAKVRLIAKIIEETYKIKPESKQYNYNELLYVIHEMLDQEGTKYLQEDDVHGGPYAKFRRFVELILYRNIANYDSMILLTSDKGGGKSSAAIMMGREWCKLLGIKFSPERNMAYNNNEVIDKVESLNKFDVLICDEAVRFACVSGDTLIKTPYGNKKIKDCVGRTNFEVFSYNEENNKDEVQTAEECIITKKDIVYELTTETGETIKCTKEHKFLTPTGWKELQELKEGDEIFGIFYKMKLLKIKSIKKIGIEQTYDIINVKNNNNYIGNNFVVHNSSEEWGKAQHKLLKKKLAQVRTKHLLFIMCFPLKIYKLEKTYLESFVTYWCLEGNTKILIEDEHGMKRNFPIKELRYKKNYKVASYNIETKQIEYKIPEKCIRTNKSAEVYEIELVNGQKIRATKEHQFLTTRGYVALENLTEDDEILVRTKDCPTCKKEFVPKKQQMIYCSVECKDSSDYYKEENRKHAKEWRINNPDKAKKSQHDNYHNFREERRKQAKMFADKNREKINKYAEEYRKNNIELLRIRDAKYRIKNRQHYLELKKKKYYKYMKNTNFKLRTNLGHRLYFALKTKKIIKKYSVAKYFGCSIEELKKHISSQFKEGMSWENYGKYTWHVDHIRPCVSFDLSKEEEIYKCFNYTNLQPLWAQENLIKNDKYDTNKN